MYIAVQICHTVAIEQLYIEHSDLARPRLFDPIPHRAKRAKLFNPYANSSFRLSGIAASYTPGHCEAGVSVCFLYFSCHFHEEFKIKPESHTDICKLVVFLRASATLIFNIIVTL